jgi:hypothetical protein
MRLLPPESKLRSNRRDIRVGKLRVQRLMQKHGIQARGKRRFRVVTTHFL